MFTCPKLERFIASTLFLSINSISFAQGKINMNGATMNVANSAYVVTKDVSLTSISKINVDSSTIKIAGAISSTGTFDVTKGTIEMNGSSAQNIPLNAFFTNKIKNLIISNNVTLTGQDSITGILSFGGSNFNFATSDSLTIKSSAAGTANVADITNDGLNSGNTITGKVTVERYNSAHKAWRFLSIPTNTSQNIKQAWQEGAGPNISNLVGYGTQITGAGGTAAGFDVYTATPSMKAYVPATNTWTGIANTNSVNIKNTNGYMVFVRGDRSAIAFNSTPTQTVLRTHGDLYTGDQTPILVSAGRFASIGNPYASSVDIRRITKTGFKDFFYLWDPNLAGSSGYGAYQTLSYSGGNYVITPGMGNYGTIGSVNNLIQSGQAFLIQADSLSSGSLAFQERDKTIGSSLVSRPAGLVSAELRANLYGINPDSSTYLADGFLINYDDSYSDNVDDMDAIKFTNPGENLSIKIANTLLVVERRQTVTEKDTIFLNLTGTRVQKYHFEFSANQLDQPGLTGFLQDTYLHTTIPVNLNGNTIADFNIANIPGSYAADRFRIVFSRLSTLPVTLSLIKAYPKNTDIEVEWKVENETNIKQYDVEKSVDGNHYSVANTVAANNASRSNYNWLDLSPSTGYNYYRVRSTDTNGKIAYSTVVKVFIGNITQGISVYPNPIINGTINLKLTNEPGGIYTIRLLNELGQEVISKQINRAEGSSTEVIRLDRYAAHGIYELEIKRPDGNTGTMDVVY